jgi:hypothetical protein
VSISPHSSPAKDPSDCVCARACVRACVRKEGKKKERKGRSHLTPSNTVNAYDADANHRRTDLLQRRDVGGHNVGVEAVELAGDGQNLHGRERVEDMRVVAHVAAEPGWHRSWKWGRR